MQFEEKARMLSAESTPYDFEGNSGVSHRIRLSVDGEIYVCKSTPEQIIAMQPFVKKEGLALVQILSRKESLSLKLISFTV